MEPAEAVGVRTWRTGDSASPLPRPDLRPRQSSASHAPSRWSARHKDAQILNSSMKSIRYSNSPHWLVRLQGNLVVWRMGSAVRFFFHTGFRLSNTQIFRLFPTRIVNRSLLSVCPLYENCKNTENSSFTVVLNFTPSLLHILYLTIITLLYYYYLNILRHYLL